MKPKDHRLPPERGTSRPAATRTRQTTQFFFLQGRGPSNVLRVEDVQLSAAGGRVVHPIGKRYEATEYLGFRTEQRP